MDEKKRARNGKELWSEGDAPVGSVYPLLLDINSYNVRQGCSTQNSFCLATSSSCQKESLFTFLTSFTTQTDEIDIFGTLFWKNSLTFKGKTSGVASRVN